MAEMTTQPGIVQNPEPVHFWPAGWWKIVDMRIGVVPIPVYVVLIALIGGFVATEEVTSEEVVEILEMLNKIGIEVIESEEAPGPT